MPSNAPTIFRVSLEVADSKKANRFYSKLLGIEGRLVGGGRVYFDCGPVILALVDVAGGKKKPKPMPQDVYFAVPDVGACHARARKLRCLSKEVVHGAPAGALVERPWGERSFYAEDPFGNGLCFVDERTLFTGERPTRPR
ncbi:MAG TPA: VOC family protein [Thermoanaerobaculia bacterium]|jgi:catechol 2,3-dioxygenase-like lactoylglutathione lyase family enzyme